MTIPVTIYQSKTCKNMYIDSQSMGAFITLHCQGKTSFLQGDDATRFILDFEKVEETNDNHYNADNLILEYFTG